MGCFTVLSPEGETGVMRYCRCRHTFSLYHFSTHYILWSLSLHLLMFRENGAVIWSDQFFTFLSFSLALSFDTHQQIFLISKLNTISSWRKERKKNLKHSFFFLASFYPKSLHQSTLCTSVIKRLFIRKGHLRVNGEAWPPTLRVYSRKTPKSCCFNCEC